MTFSILAQKPCNTAELQQWFVRQEMHLLHGDSIVICPTGGGFVRFACALCQAAVVTVLEELQKTWLAEALTYYPVAWAVNDAWKWPLPKPQYRTVTSFEQRLLLIYISTFKQPTALPAQETPTTTNTKEVPSADRARILYLDFDD